MLHKESEANQHVLSRHTQTSAKQTIRHCDPAATWQCFSQTSCNDSRYCEQLSSWGRKALHADPPGV